MSERLELRRAKAAGVTEERTRVILAARKAALMMAEAGGVEEKDQPFVDGGVAALIDLADRLERLQPTDPRQAGGAMVDTGEPGEVGGVLMDTTNAVLLDGCSVSTVDGLKRTAYALMLSGRVNHSKDRSRVLYLMDADGLASVVTQLVGVAGRAGQMDAYEFLQDCVRRMVELRPMPSAGPDSNERDEDPERQPEAQQVDLPGRGDAERGEDEADEAK